MERTIILHYHLFKNAGTSVDAILERNFGEKWLTREFSMAGGNNTSLVEEWIRETPDGIAYSSHTMMGPIPQVEGVRVLSFLLLRDPIERIKSAYRFERTQKIDTWETRLAKEKDFLGYVDARLSRSGDRQCRNFQTYRLASMALAGETELDRAKLAINDLALIGIVEEFEETLTKLERILQPHFPNFTKSVEWENKSLLENSSVTRIISKELVAANRDDTRIFRFTVDRFFGDSCGRSRN